MCDNLCTPLRAKVPESPDAWFAREGTPTPAWPWSRTGLQPGGYVDPALQKKGMHNYDPNPSSDPSTESRPNSTPLHMPAIPRYTPTSTTIHMPAMPRYTPTCPAIHRGDVIKLSPKTGRRTWYLLKILEPFPSLDALPLAFEVFLLKTKTRTKQCNEHDPLSRSANATFHLSTTTYNFHRLPTFNTFHLPTPWFASTFRYFAQCHEHPSP